MKNSPKVSIILPTYNGERYLRHSIDSCLQQTYQQIEVVLVDDCSTDGTADIIQSYRDSRITALRHERNMGLPTALNTGFDAATGGFLTWTSDDNIYMPQAIERMVTFLRDEGASFVFCDYYSFSKDDLSDKRLIALGERRNFLDDGNSVGACFLYSKDVKEAVGQYDAETRLAEDYDYWLRVKQQYPLLHLAEPLYFYREHANSLFFQNSYQVHVVKHLVQVKNRVLNAAEATERFLDLLAPRTMGSFTVNRACAKLFFRKKIYAILAAYERHEASFAITRDALMSIMHLRNRLRKRVLTFCKRDIDL